MRPLVLILCLSLTALPVAASAPTNDVARLRAEFRDEQARARRLRAEAAEAAAELAGLERSLNQLRASVGDDDRLILAQRARLRELGAREAALVAQLSQARGRQGRLLSALQMMSRRPPPPLLVPADKAIDTVRASILIRAMAPTLQARAQGLADRQDEVNRVRRLAALNSERLFTTESARGDRRARIEALAARKTSLQAVLRAEAQTAERATRALEARLRSLGATVPTADADAEPAAARLPAGRTSLTPPIAGAPSQRFGRGATGWRWRADRAEARAPAAGRVAFAGPLSGWGQVVILDLGPGWRAVVSGLDEAAVQTGDRVADGQVLGRSGADGEIAFELRRDERPIDPAPWLR
ncbi:murein hydrolase activator EnvC family protein [Brevundimonas sp.]|uniref:murein hydrolase activator EnvC family protein n=1 Tax=Brevundimonas sp. TaxID=1871086 RepID=UPI002CB7B25A|nr:peptidoglycan DD-metalloendopeptidase family protein [Brevundimonas sp.]HWQ87217.1 peptidoglycan DD-metalloendopeptidase family protein [Brevundimonas sp.]